MATQQEKEKQWEATRHLVASANANEDTDTSNPDKERDDSDKDKKKCLPATEANIRMVLAPTTELTTQERVSLPVIAIYVARIENGEHASRMKPIEVDGNIIVEGHHRFISAKLCKQEPPREKGTLAPNRKGMEYPLKNIEISPNDFGNR